MQSLSVTRHNLTIAERSGHEYNITKMGLCERTIATELCEFYRMHAPLKPNFFCVLLCQQASCKNHRVNRVVFLGNMKRLLTTGVSRWNTRQIALWDQVRQHLHMAHA